MTIPSGRAHAFCHIAYLMRETEDADIKDWLTEVLTEKAEAFLANYNTAFHDQYKPADPPHPHPALRGVIRKSHETTKKTPDIGGLFSIRR